MRRGEEVKFKKCNLCNGWILGADVHACMHNVQCVGERIRNKINNKSLPVIEEYDYKILS